MFFKITINKCQFEEGDWEPEELEKIKRIPDILMENLQNLPTVQELSNILQINKGKLTKGFKALYKDTIFSYHRKLCMHRAGAMLLNSGKSISEIALAVGYSNPSNFCTSFRKQFGMSPLQYRMGMYTEGEIKKVTLAT